MPEVRPLADRTVALGAATAVAANTKKGAR